MRGCGNPLTVPNFSMNGGGEKSADVQGARKSKVVIKKNKKVNGQQRWYECQWNP